jgi:hypothetical protein
MSSSVFKNLGLHLCRLGVMAVRRCRNRISRLRGVIGLHRSDCDFVFLSSGTGGQEPFRRFTQESKEESCFLKAASAAENRIVNTARPPG